MDLETSSKELANCTYTGNNCIIPEYIQNTIIVELLIDNALYALKSHRVDNIFEPIPETWKINNINPANAIVHYNLCVDYDHIIQSIKLSTSDEKLIDKIGIHTYGFIKFIISTNKSINIEKCKIMSENIIDVSEMHIRSQQKNVLQYKFNYTQDIEDIFTKQKTVYLYHGSPYENWYSIMRTGIKIGSKNKKLFLNGAVHGDGIYLSNDITLSLGYSSTGGIANASTSTYISTTELNKKVLAIFEVIDKPHWKKTDNIFVIDDENALILRYLLVLNNCRFLSETIAKTLNDKLTSGKQKQFELEKSQEIEAKMSKAYSKRLMMEYKKLATQNPDTLGFSMKLATEDNLRIWQLFIHKIDNAKLSGQMARLNIPYIEMEFTFPEGYPIDPPFIRIIHPHFKSLTGHITSGGSICMEAVSKSGWVPTTSVEALIIQIRLVLNEGDATIDEANYNKRYTMEDARIAFARAMTAHGW